MRSRTHLGGYESGLFTFEKSSTSYVAARGQSFLFHCQLNRSSTEGRGPRVSTRRNKDVRCLQNGKERVPGVRIRFFQMTDAEQRGNGGSTLTITGSQPVVDSMKQSWGKISKVITAGSSSLVCDVWTSVRNFVLLKFVLLCRFKSDWHAHVQLFCVKNSSKPSSTSSMSHTELRTLIIQNQRRRSLNEIVSQRQVNLGNAWMIPFVERGQITPL